MTWHAFSTHVVAALQSVDLDVDSAAIESLHTASTSAALTALVNDVTSAGEHSPTSGGSSSSTTTTPSRQLKCMTP